MNEKKNLWESPRRKFDDNNEGTPDVDPAMMPMSERKKLFEKNRTVPTPIARFGESVTPAMLQK